MNIDDVMKIWRGDFIIENVIINDYHENEWFFGREHYLSRIGSHITIYECAAFLYTETKRLAQHDISMYGKPLYDRARICKEALENEFYLRPYKDMGADGKDYEITLGKTHSEAVAPFFEIMNHTGIFRRRPFPRTRRKTLNGIDYLTALFECCKAMHIHSYDFVTYPNIDRLKKSDNARAINTALSFDAESYLKYNVDLQLAFKNNLELAERHFFRYGMYEYREASPVFDPLYYMEMSGGGRYDHFYNISNRPADEIHVSSYDCHMAFNSDKNPENTSARADIPAFMASRPEWTETITEKERIYAYIYSLRPPKIDPVIYLSGASLYGSRQSAKGVGNSAILGIYNSRVPIFAIKIDIRNIPNMSVQYKIHIDDYGWGVNGGKWFEQGEMAGGDINRPIQCIMIRLTEGISAVLDIVYRVYIHGIGWMGWAKNGDAAGTTGLPTLCSAFEIKVCWKNEADSLIAKNLMPAYVDHSAASKLKMRALVGT